MLEERLKFFSLCRFLTGSLRWWRKSSATRPLPPPGRSVPRCSRPASPCSRSRAEARWSANARGAFEVFLPLPIPDRQSSLVEKKFCDETFAASGPERSAMQPPGRSVFSEQMLELANEAAEVVEGRGDRLGLLEIDAGVSQQVEWPLGAAASEEAEVVVEFCLAPLEHTP